MLRALHLRRGRPAAGLVFHDDGKEFGVYLLTDEVATGIGRTGTMWAVEQAGVAPDLLTCGKGLTGGVLPLSAVLATEEIYSSFLGDASRTFFHGHSYTANPLCAAAALGFPSAVATSACDNPSSTRATMASRSSGRSRSMADS